MDAPLLPLLRLLQVTDSAFPSGGFAYSHGLEWMSKQHRVGEPELAAILATYTHQVIEGQTLPACRAAASATSLSPLRRVDVALDASIAAEAEREAGRAMGERLLAGAATTVSTAAVDDYLRAVQAGDSPGQYPVAFGWVAGRSQVPEAAMLAALAFASTSAIVQAAVRLNLIGQTAAIRLTSGLAPALDAAVTRALARPALRRFGSFAPGLDLAGLAHPTLAFRMFAS